MKPFPLLVLTLATTPVWAQNLVKVHVVDAAAAPISGAMVEVVTWQDGAKPIPGALTDATGTATFSLPSGADGKRVGAVWQVVAKGFGFGGSAVAGENVEIRLEKGVVWRGKVVDEAGKAVAGAKIEVSGAQPIGDRENRVYLRSEKSRALYTTQSGDDGSFQIADVPAKWGLSYNVQHPKYATGRGSEISPSVEETVKLALGASVSGRVLDDKGAPVANARVFAQPVGGGMGYGSAQSDAAGNFEMTGMTAGIYNVMVDLDEDAKFIVPAVAKVNAQVGQTQQIGELRGVTGVLVRGLVRDGATKLPVPGAIIGLYGPHRPSGSAAITSSNSTKDDGRFEIRTVPGPNKFYLYSPPAGYLRGEDQKQLEIGETAPADLVFDLKKAAQLGGITADETGKPIAAKLKFGWIGGEIKTGTDGKWSYTPTDDSDVQARGGEDETGYFEVVDPKIFEAPRPAQIVVRLRKVAWESVSGRVVDSAGAPVEGVKITGTFNIPMGGGFSTDGTRNAVSDAQGRFVLPKMRASKDVEISGKKDGFAFRSGGEVSKIGAQWTASDLVFAALNRRIEGTTAPNARVAAAGREVVADATGRFVLEGLPQGDLAVFAASNGKFGQATATGNALLRIELKAQGLQGVDAELGRKIWLETAQDPQHAKYYALSWLQSKTGQPIEDTFEAVQLAAQEPPTPARDWQLAALVEKWAPKLPVANRVEALEPVIKGIGTPEIALTAWLGAANATGDIALSRRAVAASVPVLEARASDFNWREWNLYRLAVATERAEGQTAGARALDRAIAWTMTHHGAVKPREDGEYVGGGRDEYMKLGAEFVGAGSDALIHRLLDAIEPETGYHVQALAVAIPTVAQTRGPEAALPLLDELLKMAAAPAKGRSRMSNNDPVWAFGQAARRVIPLLGAKSPQKALDLARRVTHDSHRARAIAAAARFQTGEAAAKLWREALAEANPEDVPRFAAQVWEIDRKLGVELFQTARERVAAEMSQPYVHRNLWPTYAFYFARVDAAQSRLILEREWVLALEKKERSGSIARAMSTIDATRADEMAHQIADKEFESPEARRKIGQYLQTSEELRRDLPFDRWGASDTWSPGDEEW